MEEEEGVDKSEKLHVETEECPLEINKENITDFDEKRFKSMEQKAEKMESSCELPEATEEVNDHFPLFR